MTLSLTERAPAAVMPEALASDQVYDVVMQHADRLNVMADGESSWRETFYGELGVQRTPLERVQQHPNGHSLYVKYEGDQPGGGSFKARGGAYSVMAAVAKARESGSDLVEVHIASAGNAAQGVASAANIYGLKTTAHVTPGASRTKVEALLQNGVDVVTGVTVGIDDAGKEIVDRYRDLGEARRGAQNAAGEGSVALDAYDTEEVIAGQATVGFETVQDLLASAERGELDLFRDPVMIYVPVGGGGLITGVASAMRWAKDAKLIGENVRVIGVQMEGCDAARRALPYLKRCVELPQDLFVTGKPFNGKTDGAAVPVAGKLPMAVMADGRFVAGIETVTEAEVGEAMLWSRDVYDAVAEPTAAMAVAASQKRAAAVPTDSGQRRFERHVALITGSNVDSELFDYFEGKALAARAEAARIQKAAERRQADIATYRAGLRRLADRQASAPQSPTTASQTPSPQNEVKAYIRSIVSGGSNVWSGPTAAFRS